MKTTLLSEISLAQTFFNIVIVLGLPALITPGEIDPLAYSRDYSVMLLVSIIFALLCWRRSPQPGRGVGGIINWRIYRMAGDVVLVIANTR